jgi:hypothetical protein
MLFFSIVIVLVVIIAIIVLGLALRRRLQSTDTSEEALRIDAALNEMNVITIDEEPSTFVNPFDEELAATWMNPDDE